MSNYKEYYIKIANFYLQYMEAQRTSHFTISSILDIIFCCIYLYIYLSYIMFPLNRVIRVNGNRKCQQIKR